jgi:hypothetical protein
MNFTLYADGFDEAIIGLETNGDIPRVVYSIEKMVFILMQRDAMTEEEAVEFISFNVTSAYLGGEGTPIYINQFNKREIDEIIDDMQWDS